MDKVESDKLRQLSKVISTQIRLPELLEGYQMKFKKFDYSYKMRTKDYMETYALQQIMVFRTHLKKVELLHNNVYR